MPLFFETHSDPDFFSKAIQSGLKPSFSTFKNQWGKGRSVLFPRKDVRGRTYVFGASVQLTEFNNIIYRSIITSIGIGLVVILLGMALALILSRLITLPIAKLTEAANVMATGNLGIAIEPTRISELQSLSTSLDQMRHGIQNHLSTLRESKARYDELAEQSRIFLWEVDTQGLYTYVSNASEVVLGFRPDELVGRTHFYDIHPLKGREEFKKAAFEIFEQKGAFLGLINPIQNKEDSLVWVSTNGIPLLNADGTLWGYRGSDIDITNRKRADMELQQTIDSLRNAFGTTVQVLVSAVEIRDPCTAGHQLRVANLASALAKEIGLPQEKIEGIQMAGSIHDIGKLAIPAEILSKPTQLSEIEFPLVKQHAQKGYEMLKDVESPWPLAEMVYQHHERMDGSGYPRNLKGDEILMEARILAVADVVESMASHRPYRPALGLDAALTEIENNKGTLYDADVVNACLKLFREDGFQLENA